MFVPPKFVFGGLCFGLSVLSACDFPERPEVTTISNAPVFRPLNPKQVKTVDQALSAVITVVRDDIGLSAVDPLVVYTYKNDLSFRFFGPGLAASVDTSRVAAGSIRNEIHVKMSAIDSGNGKPLLGDFVEVFAHEYAHTLHQNITAGRPLIPEWFSEGFAGWIVAKVLDALGWQSYETSLHRALRELAYHRNIISNLAVLDDSATWKRQASEPNGGISTYVLATVALHRLIQREGLTAVMNYFRTGVFASAFRVSWEDFSRDFDNYVLTLDVNKTENWTFQKPEWKVGESWSFIRKVPGSKLYLERKIVREDTFQNLPCFVVEEDGEEDGKEILVTKDSLNQIANMQNGKVIWTTDNPNRVLSWPLKPGKRWRNLYNFKNSRARTHGISDRTMVVSDVEKIRVPAGTFDTVKIEAYDSVKGRLVAEYWYSPIAKWMVKLRRYDLSGDGFSEDELQSFKAAG